MSPPISLLGYIMPLRLVLSHKVLGLFCRFVRFGVVKPLRHGIVSCECCLAAQNSSVKQGLAAEVPNGHALPLG